MFGLQVHLDYTKLSSKTKVTRGLFWKKWSMRSWMMAL